MEKKRPEMAAGHRGRGGWRNNRRSAGENRRPSQSPGRIQQNGRRGGGIGAGGDSLGGAVRGKAGWNRGGWGGDRRGWRDHPAGERRTGEKQSRSRDSSSSREGARQGPRLGFRFLQELSEKDPSTVAITLSSHHALPDVLQGTDMKHDLVELLCQLLSKAFKSKNNRGTLQCLARLLKDSNFFRTTLPHYLSGMRSEFRPARREQYPQQQENIVLILTQVLTIFPASSVETVGLLLTLLQASMDRLRTVGVEASAQVLQEVERLEFLVKHVQERSWEGTLHPGRDTYGLIHFNLPGEEDEQPVFRTMPIYPTPEEFQQDHRPYLRANITSQRYTNTLIYLDTHFRLMREDLVRSLREGIQQLRQNQMKMDNEELKKKHLNNILVYFDVKLGSPKCMRTSLAYTVQFDVQPLKSVRWENSKRLLFGSLVCLSCNNFDSVLYATVAERDPKDLKKGKIHITFTDESRFELTRMEKNQVFVMVETPAYFEAYRYVLEGLQEQDEEDMPFQRYIVECDRDVHRPAYLEINDLYDLTSIAKKRVGPFHSLQEDAWPKKEVLGLNESQMRALQQALTKELAIIQGPPGTGKTYVGLKIAHVLLNNQELWKKGRNSQMLVVCYTNHALDQFLEGILRFLPKGIVRVGGRSNSELLKTFNLRELAASPMIRQRYPAYLRNAFRDINSEMQQLETVIEEHSHTLQCSLKGILRESVLEKVISQKHWDSLHRPLDLGIWNPKSSLIMEWLGWCATGIQEMETQDTVRDELLGAAKEEVMEPQQVDLIQITEEAEMIEADRFIDDNTETKPQKNEKKEAAAIRMLQESMLVMNLDQDDKKPEQSEGQWMFQPEQMRKMKTKIKRELAETTAMSAEEENNVGDVWALSMPDRWRLYRLWMARYRDNICTASAEYEVKYQQVVDRYTEIKRDETLLILQTAKVIGMTTTGASKFRHVLQDVRPCVVIVEEAAEVLEAHIITTLSQACQHLILIGDHQQLKPSSTEYDLEKNYKMGVSMFERLVGMGLPFVRLNQQHRMRPEIARLLTPHIYADLENHPSVLNYDNIKGLNTNVFFVEHNKLETQLREGKSHQNLHEAMFVVALCRYLILQEYKPEQITILTTYTAQLHCLHRLMPASQFTGVRVHVVDKYQGEENDIILLSLVRSNIQGKVGFLNISNRICVALSRAKKGLYCFGNGEMLGQVKLWSNILQTLREKDQVGRALTLCCQNHPETKVQAACADDFSQAPEGGCTKPCEFRLDCGHVCTSVCHAYDKEHQKYKCVKNCERIICHLGHKCQLVCHATCPKHCPIKIEKTIPKCQHKQMVPCHQDPEDFVCKIPCQRTLPCGHPCDSWCGLPCTNMCKVNVMLQLKCGHSQLGPCFYKTKDDEPLCRSPCLQQLKCDHVCQGTCGQCYNGRFHSPCSHQCERLLICSHKCATPCTLSCPPCDKPCENCCVHSKCMKKCGQPCAPCKEPCAWQCVHQSCSKLCHEPCDRPPCDQPCAHTLACGHLCIGLCGDVCPSKCRVCNEDEVTEIFFGMEDDPEARFIQLEDCGHIIEHVSMDTYMAMDDAPQTSEEGQLAIKLRECPKCRTPIRKNLRYGAHVNRSLAAIEMVKKKIIGDEDNIKMRRMELEFLLEDLRLQDIIKEEQYMHMKIILESKHLKANEIWVIENKLTFMERINELLTAALNYATPTDVNEFKKKVDNFLLWINNFQQKFTMQQMFDLEREVQRLTLWTELIVLWGTAEKKYQCGIIQREKQIAEEGLGKHGQFTEHDELRLRNILEEMKQKVPITGLGISDKERKMIVAAMNLRSGHWYKCPNGHVYAITECGGAMEARKCPDCNTTIGGVNHRLATGNQVASEMDGAQHAAWSEANNLHNFENFHL